METLTTAGAGAAVVSPWWLPMLLTAHEVAAWALPFLGCLWLLVQLFFYIRKELKPK